MHSLCLGLLHRVAGRGHCRNEPIAAAGVTVAKGSAMGKFFLIIVAISIAILLALSAYVISL
jgi:hypothetical protein